MDILFLDANILFSVAYRENVGLSKLWALKNVKLITSEYALEEAKRNLSNQVQLTRLDTLLQKVEVHTEYSGETPIPHGVNLKEKDRPILAAAITAKAHYLITGDFRDFGRFYGKRIAGVTILPPSTYLQNHHT